MSPLLAKARREGREIVNVAPDRMPPLCAGWSTWVSARCAWPPAKLKRWTLASANSASLY